MFAEELDDLIEERVAHSPSGRCNSARTSRGKSRSSKKIIRWSERGEAGMYRGAAKVKEMPKSRSYDGAREARQVDNFFWHLKRYFEALNIDDYEEKVQTMVMYLTDTTALWWRRRYMDGYDVKMWEKFKPELQRQFYSESVEDMMMINLLRLRQKGSIRESWKTSSNVRGRDLQGTSVPKIGETIGQRVASPRQPMMSGVGTKDVAGIIKGRKNMREVATRVTLMTTRLVGGPEEDASTVQTQEVLVDTKAIHNFMIPRVADWLGLKLTKDGSWFTVMNAKEQLTKGVIKNVDLRIDGWTGKADFNIIDMDELGVVLWMDFMENLSATLNPYCEVMTGKEGQPEWMIPLVSKDAAHARKRIIVLQLDKGSTLCYGEWQMGSRTYVVDMLKKTVTTEEFKHCLSLIHLLSC
ncbi:hypothetical protein RJ639_041977 [Escallonia herrerae]|uniref:Retrotransposon gag domain-containing protein n=1 Tax=Escallonia herrerae TaxID=1293975 RepID=A0AA89B387_9ASTE|nr:hypothetical protein RJ639_041977 [Escallonia herrerae]